MSILNALAAFALGSSAMLGSPTPADVTATVVTPNCGNYSSALIANNSDHTENVALQRLNANGDWQLASDFTDTTVVIRTVAASDPQDGPSVDQYVMLRDQAIIALSPGQQAEIEVYGNTPTARKFLVLESAITIDGQVSSQDVATFSQNDPSCVQ